MAETIAEPSSQGRSSCPVCNGECLEPLYTSPALPVFQNMVYATFEEARSVGRGDVSIVSCKSCSHVFNATFYPERLVYDHRYQNEQAWSNTFQKHLQDVVWQIAAMRLPGKRVAEIGCGKGHFLAMLEEAGFDVVGFDPAYEGNDPRIAKSSFDAGCVMDVDLVVMRHLLEHVQHPLAFLNAVADVNHRRGKIFIEVPNFGWILKHRAFWDVFYEHCNYFTEEGLQSLFRSSRCMHAFGGQYMCLSANLADVKQADEIQAATSSWHAHFQESLRQCDGLLGTRGNVVVWGAAAKGATFVNLLDSERTRVKYLVDINPRKQGHYIGGTGHRIVTPAEFAADDDVGLVIIMNENYLPEITAAVSGKCEVIVP